MDILLSVFRDSGLGGDQALMLALLLAFLPPLLIFTRRVKAGRGLPLRPIPGFDALKELIGHAAETGRPLHLSLGVKGVGGVATAETMAGLIVLDYLAQRAAIYDAQPIVSVAAPTLLPAVQDVIRRAYAQAGFLEGYVPEKVRFMAPAPAAYAAGAMDVLEHEPLTANVMVGAFGQEYLLLGETGVRKGLSQIGGATKPQVLPFVFATADQALIGEEIFAAGAYLTSLPAHVASLVAQDWIRILLVLIILVGVLLRSLW